MWGRLWEPSPKGPNTASRARTRAPGGERQLRLICTVASRLQSTRGCLPSHRGDEGGGEGRSHPVLCVSRTLALVKSSIHQLSEVVRMALAVGRGRAEQLVPVEAPRVPKEASRSLIKRTRVFTLCVCSFRCLEGPCDGGLFGEGEESPVDTTYDHTLLAPGTALRVDYT